MHTVSLYIRTVSLYVRTVGLYIRTVSLYIYIQLICVYKCMYYILYIRIKLATVVVVLFQPQLLDSNDI